MRTNGKKKKEIISTDYFSAGVGAPVGQQWYCGLHGTRRWLPNKEREKSVITGSVYGKPDNKSHETILEESFSHDGGKKGGDPRDPPTPHERVLQKSVSKLFPVPQTEPSFLKTLTFKFPLSLQLLFLFFFIISG